MIVAIGGLTACGKSSLAEALSKELRWHNISAGKYFRKIAGERNIDIFELSAIATRSTEVDEVVTNQVLNDIKSVSDCTLDAHGACLVVSNFIHVAILLYCPFEERARRLELRNGLSLEEAQRRIETLDYETTLRLKNLHHEDFLDLTNYHLVINTAKIDLPTSVLIAKCFVEKMLRVT